MRLSITPLSYTTPHSHNAQDSLHSNPSNPQSHSSSHTLNTSYDSTQQSSYTTSSPTYNPLSPLDSTHTTSNTALDSTTPSPHSPQSPSSNSLTFIITKAHIRESLESPFSIECEGYIESMQAQLISFGESHTPEHSPQSHSLHSSFSQSPSPHSNASQSHTAHSHSLQPHSLLDSPATFSIANPNNTFTLDNQIPSLANSPQDIANSHTTQHKEAITKDTHNLTTQSNPNQAYRDTTLANSTHNHDTANTLSNPPHQAPSTTKHYTGIITALQYLGAQNANHSLEGTTTIAYKHFFSFSLTSVLKRLDYNKANRIYTHTNIIDVIKSTLSFYTGKIHKEIDFSHLHSIQDTKELITQYNESDLSFITRVAHNNGIYFYEDEHTIYFCDEHKQSLPTTIPYNPNPNNTLNEPCISSFFKQDTIVPNSFSQSSSNAAYPLYAQSLHHHSDSAPILYNQHEYRAQTSFNLQDNAHTPLQLQEKYYTCSKESIIAKSNVYHLALGQRININLNKGLRNEILKDYAIIALEQTLIDTASLANTINPDDTIQDTPFIRSYSNTLTILPSSIAFTPSPKSKPLPPFSTQGIVIGQSTNIQAESNTIYTDEYGRVRVRIHCFANQEEIDNALYATHKAHNQSLDSHITSNPSSSRTHRDSPANASLRDSIANTPSSQTRDITRESHTTKDSHSQTDVTRESHTTHSLHSKEANPQESIAKQTNPPYCYSYSPFLRVSTPIASNHSGFYHTPRVGDEVIISYMDNDIDKPYISGSLYNLTNPSLAHLPKEDHITALSARTINERHTTHK